jgi:plastocyanin
MSLQRSIPAVAGLIVLTALLAACATAPSAEPVATSRVDLPPSYRFEPEVISVPDGTTVTWTNHDNFSHSVRLLDDGGEVLTMAPGESASFTFSGPGKHRYDCSLHPHDMSGVVIVSES